MKFGTLYQRFTSIRNELLKHKWIESEKVGKDVGFEYTLIQWMRDHKKDWYNAHEKSKDAVDDQRMYDTVKE